MKNTLLTVCYGLVALGALALALPQTSVAQDWGKMAVISDTLGVYGGRLCLGEASRGDIGCPTYAPSLTTAGNMTISGTLSVNTNRITDVATPTANTDAATKAYVDSAVAGASGGTVNVPMCASTQTINATGYTGNLGGVAGANAICSSTFGTGWSFASVHKVMGWGATMSANTGAIAHLFGGSSRAQAWMSGKSADSSMADCTGWTATTGNGYGVGFGVGYGGLPVPNVIGCSTSLGVACCNF